MGEGQGQGQLRGRAHPVFSTMDRTQQQFLVYGEFLVTNG